MRRGQGSRIGVVLVLMVWALIFSGCEAPDEVAPVVIMTSPSQGATVSEHVTIACVVTDNVGVERVELWINDQASGLMDSSEPYGVVLNTLELQDMSTHFLHFRAYDDADNMGKSESIEVFVNQMIASPAPSTVNVVIQGDEEYTISWTPNADTDFQAYELFESNQPDMTGADLIYRSLSIQDTSFQVNDAVRQVYRYYQVVTYDSVGLNRSSNIVEYYRSENFVANFGGRSGDEAFGVVETSDGGFAFVGRTDSYGNLYGEMWVVKTDEYGSLLWQRGFNNSGYGNGYSIAETSDGGLIILGTFSALNGNYSSEVWAIKLSADGGTEWSQFYGGESYDEGRSISRTEDGGYIICGSTQSSGAGSADVYLLKINSQGDLEWDRSFGGEAYDIGQSVEQTHDGGFVIIGSTESFGSFYKDVWVIKTTPDGSEEWNARFGGTGNNGNVTDYVYSGQECQDGGYVFCGETTVSGQGVAYLAKCSSLGEQEWWQNYAIGKSNVALGVYQTSDGGFIVGGATTSAETGIRSPLLLKTNPSGGTEWFQLMGEDAFQGRIRDLQELSGGGYILAGQMSDFLYGNRNALLIRTSTLGGVE